MKFILRKKLEKMSMKLFGSKNGYKKLKEMQVVNRRQMVLDDLNKKPRTLQTKIKHLTIPQIIRKMKFARGHKTSTKVFGYLTPKASFRQITKV